MFASLTGAQFMLATFPLSAIILGIIHAYRVDTHIHKG